MGGLIALNHEKVRRLTGLGILAAVIVVLQLVVSAIHIGPVSFTLTLIPIVVGAAVFGPGAGAFLGFVFGVVVLLACILGWDPGGALLWAESAPLTALVCILKGTLAGFAAGVAYSLLRGKNQTVAAIVAAIVSPVVNTGIFLLALYCLFYDTLAAWAGAAGADITTYMLTGLVGVNFLIEMGVNVVLSPVIERILRAIGSH